MLSRGAVSISHSWRWLKSDSLVLFERYLRRFLSTGDLSNRRPRRTLPSSYFITTPIYYVNALPHIGHLYTSVLADAVARWYNILGVSVCFSTGTDEHGLKVQQAAANHCKPHQVFCDEMSINFKNLFELAKIGCTDYVRTTEERHRHAVNEMWELLLRNGFIYKGSYEGWYCMSDEAFLTDDQIVEVTRGHENIKVSLESGHPVEWMKEENYMFRLSKCSEALTDWLDRKVIYPEKFEPLVRQFISSGLPDLSVSRSRTRIPWGIPVPGDDTQTIYVWLDALVNYLTVSGFPPSGRSIWPADCHLVGKDILRFHAVYWPAFLIAAGLEPPRRIQCHSHWLFNKEKMSKSKGNVVDPFDRLQRYSVDGLRYYLLKDGVPHSDGNYTDGRALECINSDLVNTLGNLLSRCTALALNPKQIRPLFNDQIFDRNASAADREMIHNLRLLPDTVDEHYRDFNMTRALDAIMSQLYRTNAFVQTQRPWELVRLESQPQDGQLSLSEVLSVAMETLRICGILLQPAVPTLAGKLLTRLGVPVIERTFSYTGISEKSRSDVLLGPDIGPLFPRLTQTNVDSLAQQRSVNTK